jgi:hypothetical protein
MTRVAAAGSVLLIAASLALAAPERKAADGPPPYLPTAVGATAVYRTTAGKLTMETTDTVKEVARTAAGGVRVTVERTSGSGFRPAEEQTDVTAAGLTRVRSGGRATDPPMPVLKVPAKAGDAWEWEAKTADGRPPHKVKVKVVGEEEVEVPAGTFRAVRVEVEEEEWGRTTRSEAWYAPKVGLVKRVFHRETLEQVQVLQSFTPGKE